jgi:hypothetical protein
MKFGNNEVKNVKESNKQPPCTKDMFEFVEDGDHEAQD